MEKNLKSIRKDWDLIQNLVEKERKVLDIGCGSGGLMKRLKEKCMSEVKGIEIKGDFVRKALSEGLVVIQGDAEKDLNQFNDKSFDYVILSQTLQAMYNPKKLLTEMLRIGGKVVVSFPNFGYWKIRSQLMFSGRMPVTKGLPYTWYETPNIHFFTLKDFQEMCKNSNIFIEKSIGLTENGKQFEINTISLFSNLIIHEAIFLLENKDFEPIKIKSKKIITTPSRIATA